jgi:hypothetical protein
MKIFFSIRFIAQNFNTFHCHFTDRFAKENTKSVSFLHGMNDENITQTLVEIKISSPFISITLKPYC